MKKLNAAMNERVSKACTTRLLFFPNFWLFKKWIETAHNEFIQLKLIYRLMSGNVFNKNYNKEERIETSLRFQIISDWNQKMLHE